MKVKEAVVKFLEKYAGNNMPEDDENIFEKGIVNSLFAMQLVNFIEKEFDISVSNEELDIENFKSITSITEFVSNKLK